ncbi:MAG: hypothetical protein ACLT1X_13815, partial [Christensenellales bacterium]
VNLRNLHLHLTKNPFASRLPHLCGVTLMPQKARQGFCIPEHSVFFAIRAGMARCAVLAFPSI